MGFVADDKVPAAIRGLKLLLDVFIAGQLVQPRDDQIVFQKPVAGSGCFQLVIGQDVERKMEPAIQLILPLFGEAAGADDQTAMKIAARDQLLHEKAGHDGLAGTRVIGEQEAQRLARQHRLVDRRDLMRQRIDHRRMDGQDRIEQVGQADTLRLGDQPEESAFAVEAPGAALFDDLDARLVVAIEQLVRHLCLRASCRSAQAPLIRATGH